MYNITRLFTSEWKVSQMHIVLMKRIIFIFITVFFLHMFFNDIYEHHYLGQKYCQKQKNIVFLKTHKVNKMLKKLFHLKGNFSVLAALYKIYFYVLVKNIVWTLLCHELDTNFMVKYSWLREIKKISLVVFCYWAFSAWTVLYMTW